MSVRLLCAAHSPLINYLDPGAAVTDPVKGTFATVTAEVRAFDPELIVIFGPDHFAGFFYDLMPSFCLGVRATAIGDFDISSAGTSYRVPEQAALAMASSVQDAGVDIAVSYRMNADHGFAQSLEQMAGGVGHFPTVPIFINCAAPPLPSMTRVRRLGEAVGRHIATLNKRVLVIGSGGLSHDPPIPRIGIAPPEVEAVLIDGRNPTPQRMTAKVTRNVNTALALTRGEGTARALNPKWDNWFVERLAAGDFDAVERLTSDDIQSQAGAGGQEVRTWFAAFAALGAATGRYDALLRHYRDIPEWNAGLGIVTALPHEKNAP